MAVRIKSEEVHQLARRVAAEMGTSMTAAIETALREKLMRLEGEQDKGAVTTRVKPIVRDSGLPAGGARGHGT